MNPSKLLITVTHSGVDKATVILALLAAFCTRGRQVQMFKAELDFIEPGHHHLASGRESRSLDGWMLKAVLNRKSFKRQLKRRIFTLLKGGWDSMTKVLQFRKSVARLKLRNN